MRVHGPDRKARRSVARAARGRYLIAMAAPILAPTDDALDRAAKILRAGGLVALPTETVYGLAADAADARAVARLYAAKGRPRFNPLIAHVADRAAAGRIARFTPLADRLAGAFWPGPLTLVLERVPGGVCDLAAAGLDTLAVRVPAHPAARAVLERVGRPLAAPSANPSEAVSPTTAAHVAEGMGETIDLILDGGPCAVGLESAIVDARGEIGALLRPGGIARAELEAVAGPLAAPDAAAGVAAPGMLKRHYAPATPVRLNAAEKREGDVLLGFGGTPGADLDLSPSGDLAEAAAALFACLRDLDARGATCLAVAPVPEVGLGEAINDRLRRAAAR